MVSVLNLEKMCVQFFHFWSTQTYITQFLSTNTSYCSQLWPCHAFARAFFDPWRWVCYAKKSRGPATWSCSPLFSLTTGSCRSTLTMAAKIILTAKQNSFKFSDHVLSLGNPAIIGRSGGHVPSGSDNAYFDSKVRSRWVFEEEKK